jgi:dihydrofolate reductase
MNNYPKYIVSTTLQDPEWNNSHVLKGDVVAEVSRLKDQPGRDIMVYGSGQLVNTLLQNGLIDDCRIWTFPVILGSGRRLFPEHNEKRKLALADTKRFDSGGVVLCYQPAATKPNGSTGEDQ